MIHELRILPPLAIARFGSAATPMDNYDAVADPANPLGYRILRPAETLEVDLDSGEIVRAFVPDALSFTEDGAVRPVAPFVEVWALVGDERLSDGGRLEVLTTALLEEESASTGDLRWQVQVANLKAMRRTGAAADAVRADTGEFSDHARRALVGECDNFVPGRTIGFGHVQYIRPTPEHPEIRLRFTPAAGRIYGPTRAPFPNAPAPDPNVSEAVYDAQRGGWDGYSDAGEPRDTAPGAIYAGRRVGNRQVSSGYLDDGCDGVIRVSLDVGGRTLRALGRVGAGPPTYVPDAMPIRTVADELEQALLGPAVDPADATFERVEEIVRRAFETVRLLNTTFHNVDWGWAGGAPFMASSLVDPVAVENLHQSLLVALRSGTAPWFGDVLRDHDEAGDRTVRGRRKMPAMMRGADGQLLTLTRRQIALIRTLAQGPLFTEQEPPT
ncbi:MAG TPA: hypothetical protein VG474_17025 [Solirubrobacteraceae bacterium]|nr:hypothetical protein [Solirubrobacteraceae bacterium]